MSGLSLYLERFDRSAADIEISAEQERLQAIEQARAEGFQEGVEAGRAQAAEDKEQSDAALEHMLASLQGLTNELPGRVRAEASALAAKIAAAVFPSLAEQGLARHIIDVVEKIGDPVTDAKIIIKTPSLYHNKVSTLLAEAGYEDLVSLEDDEGLSGPVAEARWTNGGMRLDFEAAIQAAVNSLNDAVQASPSEAGDFDAAMSFDAPTSAEAPDMSDALGEDTLDISAAPDMGDALEIEDGQGDAAPLGDELSLGDDSLSLDETSPDGLESDALELDGAEIDAPEFDAPEFDAAALDDGLKIEEGALDDEGSADELDDLSDGAEIALDLASPLEDDTASQEVAPLEIEIAPMDDLALNEDE